MPSVLPDRKDSTPGRRLLLRDFDLAYDRSGSCVTSIAGPNGMRNCTGDEGGPFGFSNQVLTSSHRKLLR